MSFLQKGNTALWVVDVQERLYPLIDRKDEVLEAMCFFLKAAKILRLPLVVTEQYPKGLGGTISNIKELLPPNQPILSKTAFSGYYEPDLRAQVDAIEVENWILIGIETHICVLQTAKDLRAANKNVVVLNDATSSRSLYDYSTGMAELRDASVRISNSEAILYELVRDANTPEFKELLTLIKRHD